VGGWREGVAPRMEEEQTRRCLHCTRGEEADLSREEGQSKQEEAGLRKLDYREEERQREADKAAEHSWRLDWKEEGVCPIVQSASSSTHDLLTCAAAAAPPRTGAPHAVPAVTSASYLQHDRRTEVAALRQLHSAGMARFLRSAACHGCTTARAELSAWEKRRVTLDTRPVSRRGSCWGPALRAEFGAHKGAAFYAVDHAG